MIIARIDNIQDISPHMRRITFRSDDFTQSYQGKESAHVKLLFPKSDEIKPKFSLFSSKKRMRSYTIRYFDLAAKTLTIDFAVNDHTGLATNWAKGANLGDYIGILGSGDVKHKDFNADWHLILADLTGLPAAAATIEKLPSNAKGYAIIQVPTTEDKQTIDCPDNLDLQWLINPKPNKAVLLHATQELIWLTGTPAISIATELTQMKQIKSHLKKQPSYQPSKVYASGYWRAQ